MSVGENTNGIRGKVKATRDFYKRRENKSSCPILSCDGCEEPEEEGKGQRTVTPKGVGSVAARAQAWEKSTSTAGYVTIGSVRYGVRFSSSSEEPVPSRGSAANERDHVENDYCCDVMQMAWPRPRGTSLSPSKIPLPNAEKNQAINKRKVSEEKPTPVYRSTLEVSRPKKTSVGCFAVDTDESNSGEMKATPPTPNPARRPLFPKPNFKFGNSSGEVADTSRLIPDSKEDLGSGNQFQITLDKLHRFRFGGGNDKTNGSKKKRSSDKTERLRELTDKLLHSKGAGTGNTDRKKPPACNSTSPPKVSNKPGLRNLFGSTSSLTGSQNKKREGSVQSVESEPRVPEVKSEYGDNDVGRLESKPTGSHVQRMNAFRSASFSQVDYDTADGKYTRTNPPKPMVPSIGCVTFPRVKQVDASTSVSPPPDKVTEETGSTPSVDSAVGSDEGFVIGSSNNLAIDSHKSSGSRSLTYPFTKKTSKSDDMPFSSIDGNGLKSLQHSPSLNRELSDVKEEVSLSSETPTIVDTLSECSSDTVKDAQEQKPCDGPNPRVSPNPENKTVYQCTVKEYPIQVPSQENSLESLEKEINDLITQQKGNTSPKPEIFVTTWPKEPGKPKTKLTLKCENDYKTTNWKDEDDKSEGEDGKKDSKRWSADTSNDCSSEPISPEDVSFRNHWVKNSEKGRLMCQSSDEKEEECCRRHQLNRNDSLSDGESDGDRRPCTPMRDRERTSSPSPYTPTYDLSDSEGRSGSIHGPRRYSKRPLRGPYGQMLEAEMKKPETRLSKKQLNEDLKFLEEYITPLPENRASASEAPRPSSESRLTCPRPRFNPGRSFDDSQLQNVYNSDTRSSAKRKASTILPFPVSKEGVVPCHQRTTSSPSQLEGISGSGSADGKNTKATQELLAELLKGSSERRFVAEDNPLGNAQNSKDTRTHVVVELFDTERSYVESLQIIVKKYLRPLKSPENVGLVDASVVDEIFFQVPAILGHHEILLEELRKRLEHWDVRQKVGDIFMEVFTKSTVIETYTSFINNWKTAKEAIRTTCQQKPAFARFLEAMTREHKGKLALDSLIIMPVQRIPRYELLIQRLLKHTDTSHPDHALLLAAQHKVHELAVKINLTERETLELEQQQQTLRDLEALIEGLVDLTSSDRTFVRHDIVTMASGQETRKERALFLFSDLLIITSIKRRSGTIRKPTTTCPGSVTGSLDANKYKLLMRIPIDDLEVVKTKDENFKKMIKEIEKLTEDAATLSQISELTLSLHCPRVSLEEIVKDMLTNVNKQLSERQNTDSQLSYLELMLNTQHGIENISVVFTKAEKRASWEESFNECKQKLALSADRRPTPEFVAPVPIRKTRAGLQFTCAAPTLGLNAFELRDVWVCNSDGYVGQVCVLSLQPEPTVTSCNGVCNARILCIASIPAGGTSESRQGNNKVEPEARISVEDTNGVPGNIELVSSSSSEDDDEGDAQDYASRRSKSESIANEPAGDETDNQQPTMWLGTEDGNIHVYLCSDNVRIKKNKVKIQHGSSVQSIIYLDQKVFVSLANGDVTAYVRDQVGGWNTSDPYTVSVGTAAFPVTKMMPVDGKLWCGCHNTIRVLNTNSLQVEAYCFDPKLCRQRHLSNCGRRHRQFPDYPHIITDFPQNFLRRQQLPTLSTPTETDRDTPFLRPRHSFQVSPDASKIVTGMAVSGYGVWISLQNSAVVRLFHSSSYENLCDVNVAPAVTKMLASCDDIIRQHKAACLRVTALLACKDLLWIGTSAGVVLTMTLPHVTQSTPKLLTVPNVTGVPHGHTGHVRFLTSVEATSPVTSDAHLRQNPAHRHSKTKIDLQTPSNSTKLLVISGGDGYEDFRNSNTSEVAGREDSTNHLLLWHI